MFLKNQYFQLTSIDNDQLEEVVVIGYGTVLKKDISGSISSVLLR